MFLKVRRHRAQSNVIQPGTNLAGWLRRANPLKLRKSGVKTRTGAVRVLARKRRSTAGDDITPQIFPLP